MNSGLNVDDPTVVAAFRAALLHQGMIALAIFAVLSIVWVSVHQQRSAATPGEVARPGRAAGPEPAGRQVLRIGFGLLWLFDGLLQAQPGMAAGLPSQVMEPTAASSPSWVQHLVSWAGTTWSYHPIQAGAATVWIQAGIGLWLLAAPRGTASRLAGLASVGWGLIVWVFGESFGGIFAPGLTWLFGAPGAAAIYCAAGALIALPERSWRTPRLGQAVLAGFGLFLAGMAALQAWPGRGFWQGTSGGQPGTLTGMVQSMAKTPQPHVTSALVSGFGGFVGAHGFAVNLFVVVALAVIGLAFLSGRPAVTRPALAVFITVCLADWVLIEDFGFFGGLGTDPNSMIPMALLAVGGYLALTRVPEVAAAPATAEPDAGEAEVLAGPGASWRERLRPAAVRRSLTTASPGSMVSLGAVGVIILGAAPMAAAQATPAASTILAQAIDGTTSPIDAPAPGFTLTDTRGRQVPLSSLHGKVVLLTFLDPVCVSDCPLVAQEFRQAGQLLGANTRQVELVAVDVNPLYNELTYTQAFDRQEGLADVPNWLYLTGSPARLRQVYRNYGITSETAPGGAMLAHNDIAFVIDQTGHLRQELAFDPGPGTVATQSSFAAELAGAATQLLRAS
ncbi:MAG TPA: SCO family protein [Streptosporangiaceae bacterium]|nr:SCO family protein [Streptosporangiaceae bacterium]